MDFEKYTLILKHEMVDLNGNKTTIEQPYIMSMCFDRSTNNGLTTPIILNNMMDKFKHEILQRESTV